MLQTFVEPLSIVSSGKVVEGGLAGAEVNSLHYVTRSLQKRAGLSPHSLVLGVVPAFQPTLNVSFPI